MTPGPQIFGEKPILIFVQDFYAYHLDIILAGVREYFDQDERSLSYNPIGYTELKSIFGNSIDDRIVAMGALRDDESIDFFKRKGIPLFLFTRADLDSPIGFTVNLGGEGSLAARHFIEEQRFESLGFIGRKEEMNHQRRLREFKRVADGRRLPVNIYMREELHKIHSFADALEHAEHRIDRDLQELLTTIKKPAGIFCCDDRIALQLCFTCEVLNISVPDEISVLGLGSRSTSKAAWTEAISIVEIDHHRMGYIGAKLLDQYIRTGTPPESVTIQPLGIHHSQTTIQHRVSDPIVREAMVLIQKQPDATAASIADRLSLNRNALDTRFKRSTNVTVSKMLESERFRKAKEYLKSYDYGIESIASLSGFPNRRSMRRCFQRFLKMSPRMYRDLCRMRQPREKDES